MKIPVAMLCAAFAMTAACGGGTQEIDPAVTCHAGGYRLDDGAVVGLIPRAVNDLRYQFVSGETGTIERGGDGLWREPDGPLVVTLGECGDPQIIFDSGAGRRTGGKVRYTVQETIFDGVDGKRAGRLVLPADQETKAIVVSVHGSERWSGRTGERLQSIMPAFGIGVFAYDKRGTGNSDGKYTQDFEILAGDALRARREAARLSGRDNIPIGYWGGSQGGWVAPLAASKDGAAFVIAAYGMALRPIEEDREEIFYALQEKGYGEDVLTKVREITDVTARIVASGYTDGFKDLARVKKKYKKEPWYDELEGSYTGSFLRNPGFGIRIVGRMREVGTSWEYEPRPVIESLTVPQLWILAEKDRSAPSASTLAKLREIQQTKNPMIDIVMFPGVGHGMITPGATDENGNRIGNNVADGYYGLIRDYILTGEPSVAIDGPEIYIGGANVPAHQDIDGMR